VEKQSRLDLFKTEQTRDLHELHSQINLLITEFLISPEYRRYVPLLTQAEYIADQIFVDTERKSVWRDRSQQNY
jgi:hypothetical protein